MNAEPIKSAGARVVVLALCIALGLLCGELARQHEGTVKIAPLVVICVAFCAHHFTLRIIDRKKDTRQPVTLRKP